MRAVVVGGTGFIGRYLVRRLAAEGHAVLVFHRGVTSADLPAGIEHELDAAARLPIVNYPERLRRFAPDVAIHTMLMGEVDALAAVQFFAGHTGRLVLFSSCDVYRAYGCFLRLESDCVSSESLNNEDAPLRRILYPYRRGTPASDELSFWYDKILAERVVGEAPGLPATILRLPKVYGREQNAGLESVYRFRRHPAWRWTHGYIGNVADAIALAAVHPRAAGRVYNLGEADTPTVAERLARLPDSQVPDDESANYDFSHDLACDTSRIRRELAYREAVPEPEAMLRTRLEARPPG